jgi:hypothetical protein
MNDEEDKEVPQPKKNIPPFLFGIIVFFLVVIFFFVLATLRTNAIWADDRDILIVLKNTVYTPSFVEQVKLLFAQHNVHRVVLTRTLFFVLQKLLSLKLTYLMYVGDLFYLGVFYLLYRLFRTHKNLPVSYFLPVVFLMLSLINISNAVWAMAAVQNIGVQFFVVMTIYGLVKKQPLYLIFIWATLACLTSLTGFLAWGLIIAYFLFKRQFKSARITTLASILIFIGYKIGMEKAIDINYTRLFTSFPENLIHLSAFIGQLFLIEVPKILFRGFYLESLIIVGLATLVCFYMCYEFIIILREHGTINPISEATILYFIFLIICGFMSLVIILNTENSFFKRELVFVPSRYIIHSLIFFCFLYLSIIHRFSKKAVFHLSLFIATCINIGHGYANFDTYLKRKKLTELDYYYVNNHGVLYSHLEREGYYIPCQSCLSDIYNPLESKGAVLSPNKIVSFEGAKNYPNRQHQFPLKFIDEDYYYYKGLSIETQESVEYVMLYNGANTYVLPTYRVKNTPRNALKEFSYFQNKHVGSILLNKMKPGTYKVALFNKSASKFFSETPYKVKITDDKTSAEVI